MCEINPKRKEFYRIEFFTAHKIDDEKWIQLVVERLLKLEESFNADGRIRVHIHPLEMHEHCVNNGCHMQDK